MKPMIIETPPFCTEPVKQLLSMSDEDIVIVKHQHPELIVREATEEELKELAPEQTVEDFLEEALAGVRVGDISRIELKPEEWF